jgi:hypothetical protein
MKEMTKYEEYSISSFIVEFGNLEVITLPKSERRYIVLPSQFEKPEPVRRPRMM